MTVTAIIPIPLPVFSGALHDSWDLHELRLRCWLKSHNVPDEDDRRMEYLILSLETNSGPLHWFAVQPVELKSNFTQALDLLKNKYGNHLRREMLRLSALNTLEIRTFRDTEHKTEMVYELINQIENLLSLGGVQHDSHKRDYLLRCFRAFAGALKMMTRSTSYDGAVLAALTWEASVISKAQEAMLQASMKTVQKHCEARRDREHSQHEYLQKQHQEHPEPPTSSNFITSGFQTRVQLTQPPGQKYHHDHPPVSNIGQIYGGQLPHSATGQPADSHSQPQYSLVHMPSGSMRNQIPTCSPSSSAGLAPDKNSCNTGPIPMKHGSDTDPMVESFVDPHFMPEQTRVNFASPNECLPSAGTPHLQSNPQGEAYSYYHPQLEPTAKYAFKPLIYDPKKNPYPPPDTQVHQQPSQQSNEPKGSSNECSTEWVHVREALNPECRQASRNPHPYSMTNQPIEAMLPRQSANLTFPVGAVRPSQASLTYESSTAHLPTHIAGLPTSSPSSYPQPNHNARLEGQLGADTPNVASLMNSHVPSAQSAQEKSQELPRRKPSKLSKLRRQPSASSNASSFDNRSTRSLNRVKSLLSSLRGRRSSRDSSSRGESESTQDQGANTTSPVDRVLDNSGLTTDPAPASKLRPMQAQFSRLFRKHNHSDATRRQQRSMLIDKSRPRSEQPIKGKGRSLDFGHSLREPLQANRPIIGMYNDEQPNIERPHSDLRQGCGTDASSAPRLGFGKHRSNLNQTKGLAEVW